MDLQPFLRTPFTDIFGSLQNFQDHPECGPFEMRVVDCLEAYGVPRGREKCKLLMDDFRECAMKSKQNARVDIMWRERRRQYAAGERKECFANNPPTDSF